MYNRKELKEEAKFISNNSDFRSFYVNYYLVCNLAPALINIFEIVLNKVLFATLLLGLISFALGTFVLGAFAACRHYIAYKISDEGTCVDYYHAFSTSKEYWFCFALSLVMGLFISFGLILLIVPGIILAYSFRQAFFIHYEHPDYDLMRCLSESLKMMKGKKWKLFVLDLSFIGHFLLGLITLNIYTIWFLPYYDISLYLFYKELNKDNLLKQLETGDYNDADLNKLAENANDALLNENREDNYFD